MQPLKMSVTRYTIAVRFKTHLLEALKRSPFSYTDTLWNVLILIYILNKTGFCPSLNQLLAYWNSIYLNDQRKSMRWFVNRLRKDKMVLLHRVQVSKLVIPGILVCSDLAKVMLDNYFKEILQNNFVLSRGMNNLLTISELENYLEEKKRSELKKN